MKPAQQRGIPCSFIVKDGVVQWIGHPMSMDAPLESVVAGNWDVPAAKTDFLAGIAFTQAQRGLMAKMAAARQGGLSGQSNDCNRPSADDCAHGDAVLGGPRLERHADRAAVVPQKGAALLNPAAGHFRSSARTFQDRLIMKCLHPCHHQIGVRVRRQAQMARAEMRRDDPA